ncbi:hypothetical protein DPMN_010461 [Dreissena polymorpha]|uniref:Uncharacterized protein n=1 Tax=Dreissena polymorpha TaxID=45954 RepID=A0A9D4S122_DREPO|nr:hypothetical protein DPMN_010461 [Dreissena polymorpha]
MKYCTLNYFLIYKDTYCCVKKRPANHTIDDNDNVHTNEEEQNNEEEEHEVEEEQNNEEEEHEVEESSDFV